MPIDKTRPGYKSLLGAVMRDVDGGQKCFNEAGCDHEYTRIVPQDNPVLVKMGMTTACKCLTKCFHKYCDTFAWVLKRAEHYATKTGMDVNDILDAWEKSRDYWYMNYYQDSKQPEIVGDVVRIFDTIQSARDSIGTDGFRCPACGKISTSAEACSVRPCDWKAYGLFGTMGRGVTVFIKEDLHLYHFFMPVAWEKKD